MCPALAETNWLESRICIEEMCKSVDAIKMDLNNLLDIAVQAAKKAGAYLNEQKNTEMKVNCYCKRY